MLVGYLIWSMLTWWKPSEQINWSNNYIDLILAQLLETFGINAVEISNYIDLILAEMLETVGINAVEVDHLQVFFYVFLIFFFLFQFHFLHVLTSYPNAPAAQIHKDAVPFSKRHHLSSCGWHASRSVMICIGLLFHAMTASLSQHHLEQRPQQRHPTKPQNQKDQKQSQL